MATDYTTLLQYLNTQSKGIKNNEALLKLIFDPRFGAAAGQSVPVQQFVPSTPILDSYMNSSNPALAAVAAGLAAQQLSPYDAVQQIMGGGFAGTQQEAQGIVDSITRELSDAYKAEAAFNQQQAQSNPFTAAGFTDPSVQYSTDMFTDPSVQQKRQADAAALADYKAQKQAGRDAVAAADAADSPKWKSSLQKAAELLDPRNGVLPLFSKMLHLPPAGRLAQDLGLSAPPVKVGSAVEKYLAENPDVTMADLVAGNIPGMKNGIINDAADRELQRLQRAVNQSELAGMKDSAGANATVRARQAYGRTPFLDQYQQRAMLAQLLSGG